MLGRFGMDASSLVGVEIAPDAIRLVQLQQRRRRWRVMGSAQEPLPLEVGNDWAAEPGQVAAALRRAHRHSGLRQRRLAMALPASQVICKLCHMPVEQGAEQLEAQLLADAERLFPFPLEDLALDFQVVGPSRVQPGCSEVLVAACRQSALAALEAVVEEAGLQLEAVEIDNIALCRMLPAGDLEGAALLRIEAHRVTLHDWQQGGVFQRRELQMAGMEITAQLPGRLQALFAAEPLPGQLWVAGSSAIDPDWLQGLGDGLNVPCRHLPGMTGIEHVDGTMLLACALTQGGFRR